MASRGVGNAARGIESAFRVYRLARPMNRRGEALVIDGLEQIIEGMNFKGLDGVLIVRGDENNVRKPLDGDV